MCLVKASTHLLSTYCVPRVVGSTEDDWNSALTFSKAVANFKYHRGLGGALGEERGGRLFPPPPVTCPPSKPAPLVSALQTEFPHHAPI